MEITITRTANKTWKIEDDININPFNANLYSGFREGEYLTITDFRGATIYNKHPWSEYKYVDNVEPENSFTPTSSEQLFTALNEIEGLFFKGNTGGGGGSITDFFIVDANDVNVPTIVGQAGKVLGVNPAGSAFVLLNGGGITAITQASDWQGGALQPLQYITTNSTGTGFVQSDIGQVINTPIAVDEFRVVAKGSMGGVPNTEPFVKEIGDRCAGVSSTDFNYYKNLIYLGGNPALLSSYEIRSYSKA